MKNRKLLLISMICIVTAGMSVDSGEYSYYLEYNNSENTTEVQTLEKNVDELNQGEIDILTTLGITVPEKALDWDALKAQNEDIYAWIYIPNTYVDYPVLQHPTDLTYYLNYNIDGTKGYPGCIYSQYYNSKDFRDPNTIIYGHNMKNGTMFRTLHYFKDEDFFNNNPYIYIYTPDYTYVYEIFAVNTVSSEHLMHAYNFWDSKGFDSFVTKVCKNTSKISHVRKDAEASYGDYLLTLSTCLGQDNKRWIVVGKRLN
jgi:sortase B